MTSQSSSILIFYEELQNFSINELYYSATEPLRQLLRGPGHLDGLAWPGGLLRRVRDPGHGAGHPRGDAHLGAALENENNNKHLEWQ